jgi:transposase
MLVTADQPEAHAAIRVDLGAIFVSLELSKSTWLLTSLAPGSEKMSRHSIAGGDIAGLFTCFADLRNKARTRLGKLYPLVVIQEAGLDGFWIHRVLDREDWIESQVVDAEDRSYRWRGSDPHIDGLQAGRATGLLDGQGADA